MAGSPDPPEAPAPEEPPPILGRWRNVYALVIGALIASIAALTVFTRHYQ